MIGRIVRVGLVAIVAIVALALLALSMFRGSFFDFYVSKLDLWVRSGGSIATLQSNVVETCGKLIITQAGVLQNLKFWTYARSDFDFDVDVCVKMTVNRVHPQPEFEKPEIVRAICGPSSEAFFQKLCEHAGISK
jgi:hypothetical protein